MKTQLTRKELKEKMQDACLHGIANSFYREELTEEEKKELSNQMARVEKLFGYKPYSWMRG